MYGCILSVGKGVRPYSPNGVQMWLADIRIRLDAFASRLSHVRSRPIAGSRHEKARTVVSRAGFKL